jgi:endonuclease/exonuclease/phosphatase family metal-dependent hydrolase
MEGTNMPLRTRSLAGRAIAAAATLTVLVAPLAVTTAGAQAADSQVKAAGPALKVMTRNLYLGVDIQRPIRAIQGITDPLAAVQALGNATFTARGIVDDTDFGTRSRLLAEEIAAEKPDLVGLQEVALWRSGPLDLPNAAIPNETTVDLDFLKMLRAQLKAAGTPYRAVSVNQLSDVESPSFSGTLADPGPGAQDVRLTMHDVILKRVGSPVKILKHREKDYATNFAIPPLAGRTLDFTRGYQWVDARLAGTKFRFINTHLEAFSSDIAYRQIKEMLQGPGSYKGTTVIVCDCNSDPLLETVKTSIGDTRPHSDPYWLAVGKRGFHDTWLQWKPARFGWTSGLSETVDDADASGFDHRIDMVFARTGEGRRLKVVGGAVTGNTLASKDATTGLWPSDHAGVVMKLRGLGRD